MQFPLSSSHDMDVDVLHARLPEAIPASPIDSEGVRNRARPNQIRLGLAAAQGFHVSSMSLIVSSITASSFSLSLSYNIAWSDRYAVHPCRIGLYNYGEGSHLVARR